MSKTVVSIITQIRKVVKELSPYVAGHSGEVVFVNFNPSTGTVSVRLKGSCEHCGFAPVTLRYGLLSKLRKKIPQVKEVVAIE